MPGLRQPGGGRYPQATSLELLPALGSQGPGRNQLMSPQLTVSESGPQWVMSSTWEAGNGPAGFTQPHFTGEATEAQVNNGPSTGHELDLGPYLSLHHSHQDDRCTMASADSDCHRAREGPRPTGLSIRDQVRGWRTGEQVRHLPGTLPAWCQFNS